MNMSFKYSEHTDDEISENDYKISSDETVDVKKKKNLIKVNKKRNIEDQKTNQSEIKKLKFENHFIQLEKEIDASYSVLEENSLKLKKPDGGIYHLKIPATQGEDFWIVQHYKMSEIENVEAQQRWKKAEFILKTSTNSKTKKDEKLTKALNTVLEVAMDKFMSAPNKKVQFIKKDTK